ncbi:MAG: hypothetical protein KHY83_03480 [Coriobacteriia bacterium]|nr:hypothetical protein [Coriobacteriia bacterium]MBS5477711.1 hypothetical protein [Coriobacteriia bacterium]
MIDPIPQSATAWGELETPCFVLDEPELRANFDDFTAALHAAWSPLGRVAYSVKTNPLPWILSVAREQGCMAEVVSGDEFALALECGFDPQDVIFNGPVKPRAWLEYALAHGTVVNLDSVRDVAWTKDWAAKHPGQAHVGARVGVDVEKFCPGETITGDNGGRFGFCYENGEAVRVIRELQEAGVDVCGLHMHVTTLSRSQRVYEVLAQHAAAVVRECGLTPRFIDMGGGYYGGGKRNAGAYDAYAVTMANVLRDVADPTSCALYVEPGGAVVCTPGRYVGRVIDAKDTSHDRFVTCELSRLNIDHEMKKTKHPIHLLDEHGECELVGVDASAEGAGSSARETVSAERPGAVNPGTAERRVLARQVLCGFTCMESDRLCVLEDKPELAVGDVLLIDFAGAYSMSFTPGFFIEHAPAVYARDEQGTCTLIRPLASGQVPSGSAEAAR